MNETTRMTDRYPITRNLDRYGPLLLVGIAIAACVAMQVFAPSLYAAVVL